MKSRLRNQILVLLGAYVVAAYAEAIAFRIYILCTGGGLHAVFNRPAMAGLLQSPLLFPVQYKPLLYVRDWQGLCLVFDLYFARLVTFAVAFLIAYVLIRSRWGGQRSPAVDGGR